MFVWNISDCFALVLFKLLNEVKVKAGVKSAVIGLYFSSQLQQLYWTGQVACTCVDEAGTLKKKTLSNFATCVSFILMENIQHEG